MRYRGRSHGPALFLEESAKYLHPERERLGTFVLIVCAVGVVVLAVARLTCRVLGIRVPDWLVTPAERRDREER